MNLDPVIPPALLAVGALVLAGFAAWRISAAQRFSTAQGRRERLAWAARILMVVLLVAIALRPTIASDGQGPTAAGGLEVYIVVDTTSSVAAEDYDGDNPRLDGVRADIAGIVDELNGAHFSLVTFDSVAVQRVPLTTDATALLSTVSVLAPEITYYSSGSTIDEPVELLEQTLTLAAETAPDRPRVLFYLGDGEQTAEGDPGSFESLAPLLSGGGVLGYGTAAGGRMVEFDGYYEDDTELRYIQDYTRSPVVDAVSAIDEERLETIARELGVSYTHRDAPGGLDEVVAGIEVGELRVEDGTPSSPIEFYWALAIPLGLLVLLDLALIGGALLDLRRGRAS